MTAQEITEMPNNKIKTVSKQIGNFGKSMQFKIMKESSFIIVVTREGLLKYLGNAQHAYYCGIKNKHYKIFKTAKSASKYINK
jgi:hypothetical protein